MRKRRRFLTPAVVILLVVGVALVALSVTAVVALPLLLTVVFAGLALVVALGSRLSHVARRPRVRGLSALRHGGDGPVSEPSAETSGRRWVTQWESGPPTSALAFVRGRLVVMAAEWGLTAEDIEPALLVVTELLSNAVDHARAPVQLVVDYPGESVRVEVHDVDPEPPRLQPHDPLRARGRGLQMVEALSTRWGWAGTSTGKVIWAEVRIGWPE